MSFLKKILSAKKKLGEGDSKNTKGETERSVPVPVVREEAPSEPLHIRTLVFGVLRKPHVTEKTSAGAKKNTYAFSVETRANKPAVKKAVEARYKVNVTQVRMLVMPGKVRMRGRQRGWKPGFKKTIVTIKEGQTIEVI